MRLEPGSAENRELLGAGLAQTGRLDEAIAELQHALEIDPGSATARKKLDVALGARTGRPAVGDPIAPESTCAGRRTA